MWTIENVYVFCTNLGRHGDFVWGYVFTTEPGCSVEYTPTLRGPFTPGVCTVSRAGVAFTLPVTGFVVEPS